MTHHHQHDTDISGKRLFITMLLNFLITAVEIVGGLLSGSLSLISDAFHNFSDGISIIISWIAIRLSRRPSTKQFTFGLKRAQILAAVFNAATLIAISFFLFREAWLRFHNPEPINGR
ncbi:MAG: cation transporter, partial [Acidobacteria bacterium CG_4_9_14_3_um_filter_49_7]